MSEKTHMHAVSLLFLTSQADDLHEFLAHDPAFFEDLAIDRILNSVIKKYEPYNLRPFFRFVPTGQGIIDFRNDILKDLSSPELGKIVCEFREQMKNIRNQKALAEKSFNKYQSAYFSLSAVAGYCYAVKLLDSNFEQVPQKSKGLQEFKKNLNSYASSETFQKLMQQASAYHKALAEINYTVLLNEGTITVRGFEEEPDYNETIKQFFSRFASKKTIKTEEKSEFPNVWIGNVQSQILDGVARINQNIFDPLCTFIEQETDFVESALEQFERETQFYMAWIEFTSQFLEKGLEFSFPLITTDHDVKADSAFDLALAEKLYLKGEVVVTNDFYLKGQERIFVITGPNQGGKTTFARMFGQMHYFANLGLTVPGKNVKLLRFDQIFTHFEREEALTALHGKLYDDLLRIHAILNAATSRSIIILNEIFNSTALQDAQFLADKVLNEIIRIGALGICVTFMDELAKLGPETVSVTSMVEPDNPAIRSFHIVRRQADGLAYALSIAQKYGITYEQLRKRLS